MNPAILVTSHPNTSYKEQVLQNFGNFISQYEIDHYLFTNYPVDKNIQKLFKGSYFQNYNPKSSSYGNVWFNFPSINKRHNYDVPNWTYSSMLLLINGAKILKQLGYTHIIYLIYDTILDTEVVKNYLDTSLDLLKDKKAVFTYYNKDRWEKALSTTNCVSEIDFFIEIFENTLEDYLNKKTPRLCEDYWFYVANLYKDQISILPKTFDIPTQVHSSEDYHTYSSGQYYIGNDKSLNKIIIVTTNSDLKIYNRNKEKINTQFINQDNEWYSYEIDSHDDTEYYCQHHFLFKNTQDWRHHNYYTLLS